MNYWRIAGIGLTAIAGLVNLLSYAVDDKNMHYAIEEIVEEKLTEQSKDPETEN